MKRILLFNVGTLHPRARHHHTLTHNYNIPDLNNNVDLTLMFRLENTIRSVIINGN